MKKILFVFLLLLITSCKKKEKKAPQIVSKEKVVITNVIPKDTIKKEYITYGFDFPVGKPNAKGYYNAQKFRKNDHLGDDWNSVKGGNSDLGDPIFVIANGYVKETKDYEGGWGNVIRILHFLPNKTTVESLYAHCDTILVKSNTWIQKGTKIGTIGTANGAYWAHLHLEIRDDISLPLGGGYSTNTKGYVDPTQFIKQHRKINK